MTTSNQCIVQPDSISKVPKAISMHRKRYILEEFERCSKNPSSSNLIPVDKGSDRQQFFFQLHTANKSFFSTCLIPHHICYINKNFKVRNNSDLNVISMSKVIKRKRNKTPKIRRFSDFISCR